ncbi:MAG: GNAT family N-acetyltransferase [Frankiales bacterium]|nr:GNAT family N-acetyltransferase [Frankiales bacterium]
MHIKPARSVAEIGSAAHLLDEPLDQAAAQRFVDLGTHHFLLAVEGEETVGFVSGVETTHPDKGTEMFLYELAVDDGHQGRGVGTALVAALADLARDHGCYGMFVLTDADNHRALGAYRRAGGAEPTEHVMLEWRFDPAPSAAVR